MLSATISAGLLRLSITNRGWSYSSQLRSFVFYIPMTLRLGGIFKKQSLNPQWACPTCVINGNNIPPTAAKTSFRLLPSDACSRCRK